MRVGLYDKTFLCFSVAYLLLFSGCHEDLWVRAVRDTAAVPPGPFLGIVDMSDRL